MIVLWVLLGAGLGLLARLVAHWRTAMAPADWWALVACSLLMGCTFAWMLVVATGP